MKTVIMAGGRGTRISSVAPDIPKPMIRIDDRPVLQYIIESIRDQGFTDFIITVSYLGNIIEEYFGDGSKFGVNSYFHEESPLGNAGALFYLKDQLTEDFLLLNGDAVFDINLKRFIDFHKANGGTATIFTHPNSHPYDSGLIICDSNNRVIEWLAKEDERPEYYKNRVNAGIHVLSPKALETIEIADKDHKVDLDRNILKPLCKKGELFCYDSPEYVKDMGTPERLTAVLNDVREGKVSARNLNNKQKAIFLDRDGTINRYVGFLTDINDFELLPGAAEAIKKINDSGYLAIVVTNQPVIARGEVTVNELNEIHCKMDTLLGQEGAYIDALYYCPHHPDSGFEGEIKELKIKCECRKPNPGMLKAAAADYNIDLGRSWMVGDGKNDVLAGQNAGVRPILISEKNYGNIENVHSLLEAVDLILSEDSAKWR